MLSIDLLFVSHEAIRYYLYLKDAEMKSQRENGTFPRPFRENPVAELG